MFPTISAACVLVILRQERNLSSQEQCIKVLILLLVRPYLVCPGSILSGHPRSWCLQHLSAPLYPPIDLALSALHPCPHHRVPDILITSFTLGSRFVPFGNSFSGTAFVGVCSSITLPPFSFSSSVLIWDVCTGSDKSWDISGKVAGILRGENRKAKNVGIGARVRKQNKKANVEIKYMFSDTALVSQIRLGFCLFEIVWRTKCY